MSIKQLPGLGSDGTPRDFQRAMTEIGRIRLGQFQTPEGRKGRPVKLDRFRFTSDNEQLIRAVANRYGGEAGQYTPQRSNRVEWEVVSTTNDIEVFIPPQNIEPWNEAWRPGTCVRRCDGEREFREAQTRDLEWQPCPCNAGKVPAADLCKPTIRIQLMLPEVPPAIGTWRLESHGTYAVSELAMVAPIVAQAPTVIPASLRLREETRRAWNAEKGKYDTLTFYVPYLVLWSATPQQFALGGETFARALYAGGAPALDGTARPAIEGPQGAQGFAAVVDWATMIDAAASLDALEAVKQRIQSAGITDQAIKDHWLARRDELNRSTPSALAEAAAPEMAAIHEASPVAKLAEALDAQDPGLVAIAEKQGISVADARARILRDIEAQYTVEALMSIREKLAARGVADQQVKDAWNGRKHAIEAATQVGGSAPGPVDHEANAGHQQALREAQRSHAADPNDGAPPPEWAVAGQTTEGGTVYTAPVAAQVVEQPPVDAEVVYDASQEIAMVFAAAPAGWTTADVHDRLRTFCGVQKTSEATGAQIHAFLEALRSGQIR